MTTASALATRASIRFRDPGFAVIANSQWLAYLNEAYNRVNAASPLWPWLESTVQTLSFTAGNRSVALPTDVIGVNWAYDSTDDYRLIDQMGRGDFFHQDHLRSETGQPVTYRVVGSTMELNPTPLTNTTVVVECILMPSALAADTISTFEATGGAAGNITATGVAVGDTLLAVGGVKTADQTYFDFSSQFSITAANVINNSAGTATTGYKLVVVWRTLSSSASPIFPSAFHDVLIEGALAAAYLDDGNFRAHDKCESRFSDRIKSMLASVQLSRTETNQPIRDTFWS